jgi:hypothetical protein
VKDTEPANLVELTEQAEQESSETEVLAVSVQASPDASDHSANTDSFVAPSVSLEDTEPDNSVVLTEQVEQGTLKTEAGAVSLQSSQDTSDHSANTDNVVAPSVDPRDNAKNAATSADARTGYVPTLEGQQKESTEIKSDDVAGETKAISLKDTDPANLVELSDQTEQGRC